MQQPGRRRVTDSPEMDFNATAHNMPNLDRIHPSALVVKLYSDIEDFSDLTHTFSQAQEHGADYAMHTLIRRLPFMLMDAIAVQQGKPVSLPAFTLDDKGLKVYRDEAPRACGLAELVDRTRTTISYDLMELADRVSKRAVEAQEPRYMELATELNRFAVGHAQDADVSIRDSYDLIARVIDGVDGLFDTELTEYFRTAHAMRTSDVAERHKDLQKMLGHARRRAGGMYDQNLNHTTNYLITPDFRERLDEVIGKLANSLPVRYSRQILTGALALSLATGGFFGIRSVVNKAMSSDNDTKRALYNVADDKMPPKDDGIRGVPYVIANTGNLTAAYDTIYMETAQGQFPSSSVFNLASELTLSQLEAIRQAVGDEGLNDPLFWQAINQIQAAGNDLPGAIHYFYNNESGHEERHESCTTDDDGNEDCDVWYEYVCDSRDHHFSLDKDGFGSALRAIIATEKMPTNQGAMFGDLGLRTYKNLGDQDNNDAIRAYNTGVEAVLNSLGLAQGNLDRLPSLPSNWDVRAGCSAPSWEPENIAWGIRNTTGNTGSFRQTQGRLSNLTTILEQAQKDLQSSVTSPYQTWAYELGNRSTETVNAVGFPKGNHYFKSEIELWATLAGIATALAALGITYAGYRFLSEGGYEERRSSYMR